jgi:hypothetical protein
MAHIWERILRILQFIWLLPATILVWVFYILPLIALREIKFRRMSEFLVFEFENPITTSWYDIRWNKWAGWSGPCVYIYKSHQGPGGHNFDAITRIHELRHCHQQFKWGIFFYPAYFFSSLWIIISNLWRKEKRHAYLDNWFERDARRAAGQLVDIPRSRWMDGPDDHIPWW